MKYEILENDIIFEIETSQPGKWAIIEGLQKVLDFWKNAAYHQVFRRQKFDVLIIKIKRDEYWMGPTQDTSDSRTKEETQ